MNVAFESQYTQEAELVTENIKFMGKLSCNHEVSPFMPAKLT